MKSVLYALHFSHDVIFYAYTSVVLKLCTVHTSKLPHAPCYMYMGSSVGRALCLEYRVSWVRVPPEAAHFF